MRKNIAGEFRIKKKAKKINGYSSPWEEYVCSPEHPSIHQLAESWKGNDGCSEDNLTNRCHAEDWVKQKENFWSDVKQRALDKAKDEAAKEMKDSVVEANRRHMQTGQLLQNLGMTIYKVNKERFADVASYTDIMKAVGSLTKAIKDGVDVERKALGLADTVVRVQFVKDLGVRFAMICEKYIQDPSVLRNIAKDIEELIGEEADKLESYIERGSEVIEKDKQN